MTTAATKEAATVKYILQQYHRVSSNSHVQQVMEQLKKCRTAQLGYHLYRCNNSDCNQYKYQYHSCRNRHCPACGSLQKEQWIEDRRRELLPIPYYHVVFTLPHELNGIILGNRKALYNLLFSAASQTLLSFANNPSYLAAKPAILAVLHSWGQQLSFHPHLHCIVSGGGLVTDKHKTVRWIHAKGNRSNFLFPVKAMAVVYRAKYLEGLKKMIASGAVTASSGSNTADTIKTLYNKTWVVYAKKPFGGPAEMIEYLSRYTHKVAITNSRIKAVDDTKRSVSFDYKDYSASGVQKQMQLDAGEFIRRFEQHILPKYFTKIRSYGYLSNRNRQTNITAIVQCMKLPPHPQKVVVPWQVRLKEWFNIVYNQCPNCNQPSLELVGLSYKPPMIMDG